MAEPTHKRKADADVHDEEEDQRPLKFPRAALEEAQDQGDADDKRSSPCSKCNDEEAAVYRSTIVLRTADAQGRMHYEERDCYWCGRCDSDLGGADTPAIAELVCRDEDDHVWEEEIGEDQTAEERARFEAMTRAEQAQEPPPDVVTVDAEIWTVGGDRRRGARFPEYQECSSCHLREKTVDADSPWCKICTDHDHTLAECPLRIKARKLVEEASEPDDPSVLPSLLVSMLEAATKHDRDAALPVLERYLAAKKSLSS